MDSGYEVPRCFRHPAATRQECRSVCATATACVAYNFSPVEQGALGVCSVCGAGLQPKGGPAPLPPAFKISSEGKRGVVDDAFAVYGNNGRWAPTRNLAIAKSCVHCYACCSGLEVRILTLSCALSIIRCYVKAPTGFEFVQGPSGTSKGTCVGPGDGTIRRIARSLPRESSCAAVCAGMARCIAYSFGYV